MNLQEQGNFILQLAYQYALSIVGTACIVCGAGSIHYSGGGQGNTEQEACAPGDTVQGGGISGEAKNIEF